MLESLAAYFHQVMDKLTWWSVVGFVGQSVFGCRFLVQWIASERKKESVVPRVFWHLDIAGSLINLVYGFGIRELPVISSYLVNFVPYVRNLMLLDKKEREAKDAKVDRSAKVFGFAPTCDHGDPVIAICRRCGELQCATCARPRAGLCSACSTENAPSGEKVTA